MNTYTVEGKPIPLKRPRFFRGMIYDPQKKEKLLCRKLLKTSEKAFKAASKAICVSIEYHMPIPKSYSILRAKESVLKPHVKRPDLSNLIKFTEDALQGVLWEDDSLISEIKAKKFYSQTPKTVIHIKEAPDHFHTIE